MQVGLAFEFVREIVCMRVWWKGLLLATVGCVLLGNADPELMELPLTRPLLPGPRRPAAPLGCGEVSCGGALTDQSRTVPSAAPEARRILSGVP